ncbi:MAG TPA: tetratricopeptide repeat protein [Cellvibrionaceae bacterium]
MSAHLTEEEQIEAFKRWWQRYGTSTVASVALASALYLGWNLFQQHRADVAAEASKQYDKLAELIKPQENKSLTAEQKTQAKSLADGLIKDHKGSLYADLASLAVAKIAVEDNDLETATSTLRRVVETSTDAPTVDIARLRLAKVLAANKKVDEALGLLGAAVNAEFEASYAEAKGDILVGENRLAEAFSAYQVAMTSVNKLGGQENAMRRSILQFKLENAREPGTGANPLAEIPANPHAAPPTPETAPAAEAKQ